MQWLFKVAWCKHPVKCCNAAYHMVCKPQIQSMADRMLLQPGFAKPCVPYTLNLAWVRPTTNRGRENRGENMQSPYMWVSSFSPVVSRQHVQMLLSCADHQLTTSCWIHPCSPAWCLYPPQDPHVQHPCEQHKEDERIIVTPLYCMIQTLWLSFCFVSFSLFSFSFVPSLALI